METIALLAPLFFVVVCLVLGAILKSLLKNTTFPYTVGLFAIGILIGLLDRFGIFPETGVLKSAVDFAGNMNPDLILYLFLPILIFDGAYELDLHVFRKSLLNSTLLAGPGMVIAMLLTGLFIMGMASFIPACEGWNWSYAFMFGALISATDPVAVVALLKELGTSKRFSTLVDAESMLNDGTGIVLFMLFFGVYTSAGATENPFVNFLLVVFGGMLLGWIIARFTIWFLGKVGGDEAVQNSVIIVSSYITFILAQSFLDVSGVIALVAFGLAITYTGKPRLKPEVNQFMDQFWELMAYMANTLIFIIVGVVIAMKIELSWTSLLLVILVYVGVNIVRMLVITILYPIMKKAGYGLTRRESFILAWGGLRGALGLTLALMVSYTLEIPEDIRRQVLLFTGGIVTLTLAVNATTMRWLLLKLGLTKVPSAKMLLDYSLKKQIVDNSENYLEKLKKREALEIANWALVEKFLPETEEAPDVTIRTKDVLADVRLRVIEKERTLCWSLYNEGIISNISLKKLLVSLDELYDRDGHVPLSYRKTIFAYYDYPFYIRWIKNWDGIKKWVDRYAHERVISGYDLGRGFIIIEKESLKFVNDVSKASVLSDSKKEALQQLVNEIEENIRQIDYSITSLSKEYPISYRCAVTRKAIRMLLANEKRQVEQFQKDGLISDAEAKVMTEDLDERNLQLRTAQINRLLDKFKLSK